MYLSELEVTLKRTGAGIWQIRTPLMFVSNVLDTIIVVQPGFETDFASVPRVPVAFWLWGDRAHREAVIHDYLYRYDSIPTVTRAQADKVFLEAMVARGKSRWIRWPMYLGVRIGGGCAYHKRSVRDEL